MSTNGIEKVANVAIHANNIFSKSHEQSVTSLSLTPNGVLIDCHLSRQRLAIITIDKVPEVVGIAIGAKETNKSEMVSQVPIATLTSSSILEIMEQHFARRPV